VKIGTKLLASYAVLTVALIAFAVVGSRALATFPRALDEVSALHAVSRNLSELSDAQSDVARTAHVLFDSRAPLERTRELLAEAEDALRRTREAWARYEERPRTADEERLWRPLQRPWARWDAAAGALVERMHVREQLEASGVARRDPRWRAAHELEGARLVELDAAYQSTSPVVGELDRAAARRVAELGAGLRAEHRRAAVLLWAGLAVVFVFVVTVGGLVAQIVASIRRLEAWVRIVGEDSPAPAAVPRGEAGEVSSLAGALWDLTTRERVSRDQLRVLASRLHHLEEGEKARIARDLHDELGQLLTGLKLDLYWLRDRLAAMAPVDGVSLLLERTAAAAELGDTCVAVVQRIATDLRPTALDRFGLSAALRQEAQRFELRSHVVCIATMPERLPLHSADVATALYRIAQEALTNVVRHARATRVEVRLEVADSSLLLEIEDDGDGFDPAALEDSPGLLGMRERAALVKGHLELRRREPHGTTVRVRAPLGGGQAGDGVAR
jgi:signal transduction histidine kinase